MRRWPSRPLHPRLRGPPAPGRPSPSASTRRPRCSTTASTPSRAVSGDRRRWRPGTARRLLARRPARCEPPCATLRYAGLVAVGVTAGIEESAERRSRRGGRAPGLLDRGGADRGRRGGVGAPAAVRRSVRRPGRAAARAARQDPVALARLLRTAGQGVLEAVWSDLLTSSCRSLRSRAAATRATSRRPRRSPTRPERPPEDRRERRPRGTAQQPAHVATWLPRFIEPGLSRVLCHVWGEERLHIAGAVAVLAIVAAVDRDRLAGGEGGSDPARLSGGSRDLHRRRRQVPRQAADEQPGDPLRAGQTTVRCGRRTSIIGQRSVNGGISVFLCSNLGNGPAARRRAHPRPRRSAGRSGQPMWSALPTRASIR